MIVRDMVCAALLEMFLSTMGPITTQRSNLQETASARNIITGTKIRYSYASVTLDSLVLIARWVSLSLQ